VIAAQRQIECTAHARAINGGNHRNRQFLDFPCHFFDGVIHSQVFGCSCQIGQITTRTEIPINTTDNDSSRVFTNLI